MALLPLPVGEGKGVHVRAVTRDPQKVDAQRLPHVHVVQGDFEDIESMRRACASVDRAFLVTNSTARTEEQQVAFTRVAHQSGVRHILHPEGRCFEAHRLVYGSCLAAPRHGRWTLASATGSRPVPPSG